MKHRALMFPFTASLLVLLASACGGSDASPSSSASASSGSAGSGGAGGSGGEGGSTSTELSLTWAPCNLFTEGPKVDAECAEAPVPLRWSDPSDRPVTLFVKRLPASGERRGTLWLLDGGPGGGGIGPEGVAQAIAALDSGLDIYIPHHRGTGLSSKLTCPANEEGSEKGLEITKAEWPGCIDALKAQWGEGLAAFNTTEAARDLGALIEAVKEPGDATFVLGSSYGTYLANRYLRLFPDQASGVIYDSVCPPDGCDLDKFDVLYDGVASDFLKLCGADAVCSSHVGPDPRARLGDVYASLDAGHCPALAGIGVDRRTLRTMLGVMLNDWNARLGIPAVIRRVERCDPADIGAIEHLLGALFGDPSAPPPAFLKAWSFALGNNITFSELWSDPPPAAADIKAASDATFIAQGVMLEDADIFPLWPKYERDEHFGAWGDTSLPMLMMNGDLDPATPISIAEPVKDHFKGANQTWVTVPRSPHGVISGSPIKKTGETCGMQLIIDFLADPKAPLDTSCKDQVLPLNFAGAEWLAQSLFGTSDMYDNP